jgi:hypothetical protein
MHNQSSKLGSMVPRLSSRGNVFYVWEPEMPRIRDAFLDCVIYLYPDAKSADEGERIGGSGFLVGISSQGLQKNFWFLYAVTNKHVVTNGATTIRFSTRLGEKEIFETDERSWVHHPDGDDVSACLVSFDPKVIKFNFVRNTEFLDSFTIKSLDVGIGDDVFVVGRFISHEGKQQNNPTARFGCIAQMPWEPIIQDDGFQQESFLVEARSIGGFSGSPVFLHVGPDTKDNAIAMKRLDAEKNRVRLLGIEWGLLQMWEPVCNELGKPINPSNPKAQQVAVNTGMMGVVPVWKLTKLLNQGPLAEYRAQIEQNIMEKQKPTPPTPRKTSVSKPAVSPPASDENPTPGRSPIGPDAR